MGKEIAFHVFTTHATGRDDGTPMQLASLELLRYYQLLEAIAAALGAIVLGGAVTGLIVLICSTRLMAIG
jgi:hypothetical protein